MERILRATAIVGLSSLLTVALGALRYKFIALQLGAEGVGLLGILTSAATFGVVLFSAGLNTSGVQAAAATFSDIAQFQRTRSALLGGSRLLGIVGGSIVVVLGLCLGDLVLPHSSSSSTLVIWLGIALAAMVISGGNLALLNGMGRIRALAGSNAWGSIVGTAVTLVSVTISGEAGLVAALAAAPLATLALSSWYLRRETLQQLAIAPRPSFRDCWPELRSMFMLGGAVMIGAVFGSATQFFMRVWLDQTQGLQSSGYFQAAWTITSMYLGFVLTALAVEYYPRISKLAAQPIELNLSVDRQINVALLLGAPVLLWMMVFSPLVLHVLYAEDFQSATSLLRWQLFGDIFKIVGWAIAFLLLARRAKGPYLLADISFNACYLLLGIPLASQGGVLWLGVAYAGAYAAYLGITLWLAHKETRFVLTGRTLVLLGSLIALTAITLWGLDTGTVVGVCTGIALASTVSVTSLVALQKWRANERRLAQELGADV
jgi:PST family polysaccharide transporter